MPKVTQVSKRGSWAQRKAGWLGAHAAHHGTIQEEELIFTPTTADAHSILENQSHERCHSASQTGQGGLTSSPARKQGGRPSAGQYCCLSTVWPLGTTAQQLPQTKSTHLSYLGKLLLGIYLADAHVAKVSARMVTTTLFMCQKTRTTSCPTDKGLAVSSGMRSGGPQVEPQPKPQPTFTQCY